VLDAEAAVQCRSRAAVVDNRAPFQHDEARRVFENIAQPVLGHEDGTAGVGRNASDVCDDRPSRVIVENGRGLIQQKEPRPERDDARDADPPLLPEGQRCCRPVPQTQQAVELQGILDSTGHLCLRQSKVLRTERNLVFDDRREQLVVRVLEHKPRALGDFPRRKGIHRAAVQFYLAT